MTINNLAIQDVAKYIGLSLTTKGLSISPLKLQKMLYYTQAWFMVFLGRENTLFKDIPQAWVNGPVYPAIYHEYKDKADNMCDHLDSSVFYQVIAEEGLAKYSGILGFNSELTELIESIMMLYGAMTQNRLILLTHSERPWAETRGNLPPYARSAKEIPLDLMYEYYKERHDRNRAK